MKKTSLDDIAKALGVSRSLVSLVLNNRGDEMGINKQTQQKVFRAARKMNYKPNLLARGLRLGASKTLGLVIPNIGNYFFARIARVIEDEAGKYGYRVMSVSSDEDPEKEVEMINVLIERQVDGLILASSQRDRSGIIRLRRENIPFVLIDRYFPKLATNYVITDNYTAAYNVISHLIDNGYKKIGLLKYTPSHLTPIRFRCEGYRNALKDHGLRYSKALVKEIPSGKILETMQKALPELLFKPVNADALFFLNNDLTIAGLNVINGLGLRVPYDVAIVSFDDLELFNLLYPPVTAVAQPWQDMARHAVRILINELDGSSGSAQKEHIVLPASLEIRRSSSRF